MSGYRLDVTVMFSFGTIVYTDLYGEKYTTSWKHRVVREGKVLKTYALPGGYSSEWEALKSLARVLFTPPSRSILCS